MEEVVQIIRTHPNHFLPSQFNKNVPSLGEYNASVKNIICRQQCTAPPELCSQDYFSLFTALCPLIHPAREKQVGVREERQTDRKRETDRGTERERQRDTEGHRGREAVMSL